VDPWTIRRLAAVAGGGSAQAVLIGCDTLDAAAALHCGLASRLGDLAVALAWARELATLAPLTLAYSKQVLNTPPGRVTDPEYTTDSELLAAYEACWASGD
jgi:enoyl-CoA hydratase